MISNYGLLNGQPIGPTLPPSVPCEVCGHPVYLTKGATVFRGDQPTVAVGVFEQDFPPMGSPWALTEHRCRRAVA